MEARSTPTPFLRDHRPKAFTLGSLEIGEDDAWVADSYYPLLLRLDGHSGQVEGPIELKGIDRDEQNGRRDNQRLAIGSGAVWCGFGKELVRCEPETGSQDRFALPGSTLAAGPEGVWTGAAVFAPDGDIFRATGFVLRRLDESDGSIKEFDYPGRLLQLMDLGHGAVWVATFSPGTASTTALVRIAPDAGEVERELELSGMARQLWIDDARIWILTNRLVQEPSELRLEVHLMGIDPETMQVLSDLKDPQIYEGALQDGEVWTRSQFEHLPAAVRRLDPLTGESLGEMQLSELPLRQLKSGRGGVWADQISTAVKLGSDGPVAEFQVQGLPVPEHLVPPPLPEIKADEWEARARDELAAALETRVERGPSRRQEGGRVSRYEELDFESCELLGSFPNTQLAVYFRIAEHPGVLFGRRWRLWEPDGGADGSPLDGMTNLMEDVDKGGGPLLRPGAVPDQRGIVWI
jgi:hypothetical protein